MLEPQQKLNPSVLDPSIENFSPSSPQQTSNLDYLELVKLSDRIGPIVLDGNAIATILGQEQVGSPAHLLQLLSRIETDYSEVLGALRQVLRPEESLDNFRLEPIDQITREQFGALVELYIQRIRNGPQLPSFSSTSKLSSDTVVDGDILGLLPASSTVTLRDLETLSAAAILCKRLLSSAKVAISGPSIGSESCRPSREETLSLFASILFRRAALGDTIHLPNIPYWSRQLEDVRFGGLASPEISSQPTRLLGGAPTHMNKHGRSA